MRSVLVFDFLSHAHMHQPFNEGYLRVLRAAFPDDELIFHAGAEHAAALAARFSAADRIGFRPVAPFAVPIHLSRHNPLAGRLAAWRCWRSIAAACAGRELRLVAVLGFDANLLAVLRRVWPSRRGAALHLILHNHFAEATSWRSRNPLLRAFDLIAGLQRPLPPAVRLVVLELGIREAIAQVVPAAADAIDTLEHPILESEWCAPPGQTQPDDCLRVGFLGHASLDKGFGHFTDWARENRRPELEFHAVGLASSEAIDLRGLARPPSPTSLSRADYVAAMGACDVVCLPLSPIYDYVASGSVIDAIAGLKPLFAVRNHTLSAMAEKYGAFGYLAEDLPRLRAAVLGLDAAFLALRGNTWIQTLTRIRQARRPNQLAPAYAASVERISRQRVNVEADGRA